VRLGLSLQVSPLQLSAAVREDAGLSDRVATAVATRGRSRRARSERRYRPLAGTQRVCPSSGKHGHVSSMSGSKPDKNVMTQHS
jgi:hypothetical protein